MENKVIEAVEKLRELSPIVKNCYELNEVQRALLADKTWITSLKNARDKKISSVLASTHPFKHNLIDADAMGTEELAKEIENAKFIWEENEENSVIICPQNMALQAEDAGKVLFVSDNFCQDILASLARCKQINEEATTADKILNHWVIKPYQQIMIYGDALISGIYAAYAALEIKQNYGKYPLILLYHDNALRNMDNTDANGELLQRLGIPVFSKITETDIYAIPEQTLFITPWPRLLHTQKVVEGSHADIYTVSDEDFKKNDNLSLYYMDVSMQKLSNQKRSNVCRQLWKRVKASHKFEGKSQETVQSELSAAIKSLVREYKPRLDERYGKI